MNILITGGAGYIGTELVYALNASDQVDQIVFYDNLSRNNYNIFLGKSKLDTSRVRFVKGDILDSRRLKAEVERADVVFHLAAKVTTPFADHNPHEFDQVNNWGTAELVYLIENSDIKKFVYASSLSVYGSSEQVANVDSELNPKTFYGISKMHGEQHVERLIDKATEVYILRLGNVYGYNKSMRFDSVINKFMFESNFMNRIKIFGDGHQTRSFIHVERLSHLLKNVALRDIEPGTYNVVENTYSVNDIVDALQKVYPDLEMTFVNQNMKMRSLNVERDGRIDAFNGMEPDGLIDDLMAFKERFTF
ncbi:MAG: NAD-dependent epimerase/dehydratase [Saprospiraceae bacterium]|nr:NAD-dependent epimerase/dehydratase [Saprospiraceae bacterium]